MVLNPCHEKRARIHNLGQLPEATSKRVSSIIQLYQNSKVDFSEGADGAMFDDGTGMVHAARRTTRKLFRTSRDQSKVTERKGRCSLLSTVEKSSCEEEV